MIRPRRPAVMRRKVISLYIALLACLLTCIASQPLLGQRVPGRYIYKEFDGIYVFYKPRDLAMYRRFLPEVFEMPDGPLVQVFISDYYKMDSTTQPYLEAAVFLLAQYQGEKAWHCITMPLTSDEARRLGILFLGFPKVMGEITLERSTAKYQGTLRLDGTIAMSIMLAPDVHSPTPGEKQWFQELAGIPSLNLLNGRVIDPMGGRRRARMSLLDMAAMFPEHIEVKVGKAEISLRPGTDKERLRKSSDPFGIQPAEIVLAYYLKNKFGFSFGGGTGETGTEK